MISVSAATITLTGPPGDIPAYVQVAAFLVTLSVALLHARRDGLDVRATYWAGVWGIAGALIGGRLGAAVYDVVQAGTTTLTWDGPRSALGAFAGAGAAACAYLRTHRVPVLAHADSAVAAIALGYGIARVGCLLAGDDFGVPIAGDWGIRYGTGYPAHTLHVANGWIADTAPLGLAVHPVQAYHAAVGLLAFVLLRNAPAWERGTRLALAVLGYAIARFGAEFLRADATPLWGPFDLTHLLCASTGTVAAAVLLRHPSRPPVIARAQTP